MSDLPECILLEATLKSDLILLSGTHYSYLLTLNDFGLSLINIACDHIHKYVT